MARQVLLPMTKATCPGKNSWQGKYLFLIYFFVWEWILTPIFRLVLRVICHLNFMFNFFYKVLELVGGGFVIKRAYLSSIFHGKKFLFKRKVNLLLTGWTLSYYCRFKFIKYMEGFRLYNLNRLCGCILGFKEGRQN